MILFEAAEGREGISYAEQHEDLDLVLLDLGLPDRDGFDVLVEFRDRFAGVAVVVLSALDQRSNVIRALDLGALGFIPKNASREVMLRALQLVSSGGIYIPPQALHRETTAPAPAASPEPSAPAATSQLLPAGKNPAAVDPDLTTRQLDVLALMMQGMSNKVIGRMLDLAEPTVKHHVSAIMKAFEATNRTEVVIAVNKLGWRGPGLAAE